MQLENFNQSLFESKGKEEIIILHAVFNGCPMTDLPWPDIDNDSNKYDFIAIYLQLLNVIRIIADLGNAKLNFSIYSSKDEDQTVV
ncbi:5796_t:CDS:2, partial [Gigaspora margarita]